MSDFLGIFRMSRRFIRKEAALSLFIIITLLLTFSCERNREPVVSDISIEPEQTSAGAKYSLSIDAYDEDGDPLNYLWEASHGEFLTANDLSEVTWNAPADGEGLSVVISVSVSDGENEVFREIKLNLSAALFGNIQGYVSFRNIDIPISDVRINVGNKESATNKEGFFSITGLIAGKDSLFVSKEDYITHSMLITVIQDKTLDLEIELLSYIHSTKTYGVVRDQEGKVVDYAQVIVLNPDGSESRLKTYTDQNGLFRISFIPHGTRTLVVRKDHTENERFNELRTEVEFIDREHELNLVITKEALSGQFTDPRDQHVYTFKKIGDYFWMTENLAYLPQVNHPSEMSESEPHYYVYDHYDNSLSGARNHNSYIKYGVIYNWMAAKQSCPPGWYLPGNFEYSEMGRLLGDQAGKKMKSRSGWFEMGNGNNSSGFSAIPGGYMTSGTFGGIEKTAFFYAAANNDNIYSFSLSYDSESLNSQQGSKQNAFSVRCVKLE